MSTPQGKLIQAPRPRIQRCDIIYAILTTAGDWYGITKSPLQQFKEGVDYYISQDGAPCDSASVGAFETVRALRQAIMRTHSVGTAVIVWGSIAVPGAIK